MKNAANSRPDVATELAILRKIIIVLTVIFGSVFLGRSLSTNAVMPATLIGGWFMLWLLIRKPDYFLYLGLFFFYRALNIIDVDTFGRLPGFFRLKDIFLLLLLGRMIADACIGLEVPRMQKSLLRTFLIIWLCYIAFQMFRTVTLLGEEPVLMFRAGRKFLTYALPFIIFFYVRTEQQWKQFFFFLIGMACLTFLLSIMSSLGLPTSISFGEASYGRYFAGVFKYYSPGESLVFCLFMLAVWTYCFKPTRFLFAYVSSLAVACSMFVFRARLAGIGIGLVVASIFAPANVRRRAAVTGVVVSTLLLIFLLIFPIISKGENYLGFKETYVGQMVDYFEHAYRGLVYKDTDDIFIRQMIINARWPIIQMHPLAGVGFISPFGKLGWDLFKKGLMPIGAVDVGWIDALTLFGSVGSSLLGGLLFMTAMSGAIIALNQRLPDKHRAFGLTAVSFIVLTFISVYSFAYPTEESSMVTISILLTRLLYIQNAAAALAKERREKQEADPLPT